VGSYYIKGENEKISIDEDRKVDQDGSRSSYTTFRSLGKG
jgi:hypothetical protein